MTKEYCRDSGVELPSKSELDLAIDRQDRLCFLLGIATSMILSPTTCKTDHEWWLKALEEVVYKNNPIPEPPK